MSTPHLHISCIRVNGAPILPPLMTQKRREECKSYKQKAIDLERQLQCNKLFEKCMKDLMNLQPQTEELIRSRSPQQYTITTLEQQLTFDDTTSTKSQKLQNLTSETIDVSEYSKSGVKVLSRCESLDETIADAPELPKESPPLITKPKLIRSNSYTLESPSPILLAHLEKEANKVAESNRSSSLITDEQTEQDNFRSLSPNTVIYNETDVQTPQTYEVIETDITVQQVSVSTPIEPLKVPQTALKNTEIEPQLLNLLSNMPKESATRILEILEQQKVQHEQIKDEIMANPNRPNNLSISSSQSLYYSLTDSSDTFTPRIGESLTKNDELNTINLRDAKKCNRTLFPYYKTEQEWAASVIGAAARGYLVRRLVRTDKVQSLIQTIQDALLCAIQLHNADNIDESDIELHRRLIQQVSAACYAFHDVFFALSTKERMSLISQDRHRRRERLKRPLSSSSRISDSNRTTPRSKIIK